MKIEINPRELLSPKNRLTVSTAAAEAGLPFEIFVFKAYDELLTSGEQPQRNDDIVQTKTEVIRKPEPPQQEEGPFDHLNLHSHGKSGTRAHNLLVNHFDTVDEFLAKTYSEHIQTKGLGRVSLELIVEALMKEGYISGPEDLGNAGEEPEPAQLSREEIAGMNVKQLREALGELDLPIDGKRDELIDRLSLVHFGDGTISLDDGAEIEEDEEDYLQDILGLDPTSKESIGDAARIYMKATGKDYEVVHEEVTKLLKGTYDGDDEDTYWPSIELIRDQLPMTQGQQENIFATGKELGENKNSTLERAISMAGKEFDELTFGEARALLTEMNDDLNSEAPEVGSEFVF